MQYYFVLNSIFSLVIGIGLAALPDLLQDIAHVHAHHLLASAGTRIPAPALILGAAAVLGPDHILGLPLAELTTGTRIAGENCCPCYGFPPKNVSLVSLVIQSKSLNVNFII